MKKTISRGGTVARRGNDSPRRIRRSRRGDFESLVSGITKLAASLNQLHKQMADQCAPIVPDMIRSRCRDKDQIERLLDRLLDCACIPEGLNLFKTLCRYYYTFDPAATADYVYAYRDMWDSEEESMKVEG